MTFDVDRYYTPSEVAVKLLEGGSFYRDPTVCADSACGTGSLLEAAHDVFGASLCVGLDVDRSAIEALRRRKPNWLLSVGDLLNPASFRASRVGRALVETDLLLLNPPFSQGQKKALQITFAGHVMKASLAMAYILRSLDLFQPASGALAIVPESLLYSDVDARAREVLAQRFAIRDLGTLKSTTFSGTRARAIAVQLCADHGRRRAFSVQCKSGDPRAEIIRGALCVHLMRPRTCGSEFIHTTDLKPLAEDQGYALRRTHTRAKGRLRGWVVLLPRVGVPDLRSLVALHFRAEVQLSDCVIAARFDTERESRLAVMKLRQNIRHLQAMYRGTGARYITIQRLVNGLMCMGIDASAQN